MCLTVNLLYLLFLPRIEANVGFIRENGSGGGVACVLCTHFDQLGCFFNNKVQVFHIQERLPPFGFENRIELG